MACYRPGAQPVGLAANDTCNEGFYCPNSNNEHPPQFCPPTDQCQVMRMTQSTCSPQGPFEPKICANGFYCPPGGKQQVGAMSSAKGCANSSQIECPKGTFCPSGSRQPLKCAYGALCPAGSVCQIPTLPLTMAATIDFFLVSIAVIVLCISLKYRSRPKQYTAVDLLEDDHIELLPTMPTRPQLLPMAIEGTEVVTHSPSVDRRALGRVDHMDGADDLSLYDDSDNDSQRSFESSPMMEQLMRSISDTIETNVIGLSFDFDDLTVIIKSKPILQHVTGSILRGSCWGVMGGSGAGKSTFVNALMGKIKMTYGDLKVNGHPKSIRDYKKLIGYVPQDDIIFPDLTVRENILHSARIRLPSHWRDAKIQQHVDSLIACLQLSHVQHSRVGDATLPVISGGQRKRVNIGMELAAAPMAIFLDEPTSGLDASSSANIMQLIRAISRLGVTTIAIIHQPREQIFYGFDQLLLLAQGSPVYSGATRDVEAYFEGLGFSMPLHTNPADTLIDIVTGNGAKYASRRDGCEADVTRLIREWWARRGDGLYLSNGSAAAAGELETRSQSEQSTFEQEEDLRRTMRARGASWLAQVYYCWMRAMTQQARNATSLLFEVGVAALAGVVIGLSAFAARGHLFQGIYHYPFTMLSSAVDYQSTPQIGLLGAMSIGLAASAPGFWVFGEEKLMYHREFAAGHSRSAYYVGKLLSTLPRIALTSLHYTVFLGILATPLMSFWKMYAVDLGYFWGIYGLASVVSMLVKRQDGPLIAVLASLVIGVLGGVAPPLKQVKVWRMEWFWRMSPGVWFTESYFTENITPLGYLYRVDVAADATGFTLDQYALDLSMLFVIGVVYRVVAFVLLFVSRRR
ncbi:ABC transporter, ABC-G family, WBC-type [Teratosphaeria destructans]|uniref:ABC transporter, ABC-G family, WBC-type n=1 Tax=Teratosphaeria destructans TaxID=418781 RepID=A0A9W7STF2_9PEZI|nr:ABC transporter, ABC-G family, WBC-type [Teratosphaeria destructans]